MTFVLPILTGYVMLQLMACLRTRHQSQNRMFGNKIMNYVYICRMVGLLLKQMHAVYQESTIVGKE